MLPNVEGEGEGSVEGNTERGRECMRERERDLYADRLSDHWCPLEDVVASMKLYHFETLCDLENVFRYTLSREDLPHTFNNFSTSPSKLVLCKLAFVDVSACPFIFDNVHTAYMHTVSLHVAV